GATQRTVVGIFAWEMIWLGLVASLIGCAVGYAAHVALAEILTGFIAGSLPAPSPRPLLVGVAAGMVILIGFALPPLLALRHVPPTRVLRRDLGAVSPTSVFTFFAALAAMISLMAWQARDLTLFTWALGGTLATLLVLSLVALILVRLLNRLRGKVGVAWRFGLANIARRARGSAVQIVAFGVGVMVLLLLSIVRTDLLDGWRRTIPVNAPNHFLINVQPDQVTRLQTFLSAHGIVSPTLYPMVRARLVEINGEPVSPRRFSDAHARRHVMREFNLSWAARLRGDNHVVAGRWWIPAEHGQTLISFEQRLAETLGIRVGDRLKYNVADTELELRVINLRAVDWDTFNVNFFTILPPGVLDGFPATYVTSFYLPAGAGSMLPSLVKTFPNVTVIDVDALMTKVRLIMERVSVAVEYVFLFTLVAGLAVLYAALQATQDERRYESAVLRTLGARQHQLFRSLLAEFATLGMLAGLLAGFAATLLGYILAEHVFHIPYQLNPWIWLLGWIGGTVGISIAGTLGTRRVLHQPPLKTLREV
ncbi:MAG: ABC transporter permease, partial [Gemmatimonadales bacterium]